MESPLKQEIQQLHASPWKLVLAITGGGSGAISALLEAGGGSATVLEAIVPYAQTSLDDWLRGTAATESSAKPLSGIQACSATTARVMAMTAWQRAITLAPDTSPSELLGIGCTASLGSTRPKRGDHRFHVAVQSATTTRVVSVTLEKGSRTRPQEETIVARTILGILLNHCDLLSKPSPESLHEELQEDIAHALPEVSLLLTGEQNVVQPNADSDSEKLEIENLVIFPGAFNPAHEGHFRMAEIAELRLKKRVSFEISITNVDKPMLDFIAIRNRLKSLTQHHVLLTRAPTFVEKSKIFPGAMFIVGADTAKRIASPRYYDNSTDQRDEAIQTIAGQGCRFLVFGREIKGQFQSLDDLHLPDAFADLCDEVSAEEFRNDISSTELRNRNSIPSN